MKSPRFTGFTTNEPAGMAWFACRLFAFCSQRVIFNLVRPQLAGRVYAMMIRPGSCELKITVYNHSIRMEDLQSGRHIVSLEGPTIHENENTNPLITKAFESFLKQFLN